MCVCVSVCVCVPTLSTKCVLYSGLYIYIYFYTLASSIVVWMHYLWSRKRSSICKPTTTTKHDTKIAAKYIYSPREAREIEETSQTCDFHGMICEDRAHAGEASNNRRSLSWSLVFRVNAGFVFGNKEWVKIWAERTLIKWNCWPKNDDNWLDCVRSIKRTHTERSFDSTIWSTLDWVIMWRTIYLKIIKIVAWVVVIYDFQIELIVSMGLCGAIYRVYAMMIMMNGEQMGVARAIRWLNYVCVRIYLYICSFRLSTKLCWRLWMSFVFGLNDSISDLLLLWSKTLIETGRFERNAIISAHTSYYN